MYTIPSFELLHCQYNNVKACLVFPFTVDLMVQTVGKGKHIYAQMVSKELRETFSVSLALRL